MHRPSSLRAAFAGFSRLGPFAAVALWGIVLALGFRIVVTYELKAGSSAAQPPAWLGGTALPFDSSRANLVMFAHPQCPCSRASLAELAVIMTRAGNNLRATVCFFDPDSEPESWTQSALWRSAAAIPGVTVVPDRNGEIAARFGSATSGQTFLFDREGQPTFSGGITGARGHEGENRGRSLVIALARGELCSPGTTPVFGCSLAEPAATLTKNSP